MPRIKNPNYETRAELQERCKRQKRTIRIMLSQLDAARRTLSRIAELAGCAAKHISVDAWSIGPKEKEQR